VGQNHPICRGVHARKPNILGIPDLIFRYFARNLNAKIGG
jgi:hypothetical protein